MNTHRNLCTLLFVLIISNSAFAGNLTVPNTFTSGTPAIAQEVNDNFSEIENQVNDNDSRIATLETKTITIAGVAFSSDAGLTLSKSSDGGFITSPLGAAFVYANVNVPLNATITGFEILLDDGTTPAKHAYALLKRMNINVGAVQVAGFSSDPLSSQGIITISDYTLNELNDDASNFYYVQGRVDDESKIYYVRIYYTH